MSVIESVLWRGEAKAVYTLPALPNAYNFCMPTGIGDVCWLAPKLIALGEKTGREVRISAPDSSPQRLHQLLERIDGLTFAGYEPGMGTSHVFSQSLHPTTRVADIPVGEWCSLAANTWLETEHRIETWLPELPHDYHWSDRINVEFDEVMRAEKILEGMLERFICLYGSNRGKDHLLNRAWRLWRTDHEWLEVIEACCRIVPDCGFVTVGAEWDDREDDFAAIATKLGWPLARCRGESFGTLIEVMRQSAFGFYFNSGLGFLCDVLRKPCFMLMPNDDAHRSLCHTCTDPAGAAYGWKAISNPTAAEGIAWLEERAGK